MLRWLPEPLIIYFVHRWPREQLARRLRELNTRFARLIEPPRRYDPDTFKLVMYDVPHAIGCMTGTPMAIKKAFSVLIGDSFNRPRLRFAKYMRTTPELSAVVDRGILRTYEGYPHDANHKMFDRVTPALLESAALSVINGDIHGPREDGWYAIVGMHTKFVRRLLFDSSQSYAKTRAIYVLAFTIAALVYDTTYTCEFWYEEEMQHYKEALDKYWRSTCLPPIYSRQSMTAEMHDAIEFISSKCVYTAYHVTVMIKVLMMA
jgi:hypothetical protein